MTPGPIASGPHGDPGAPEGLSVERAIDALVELVLRVLAFAPAQDRSSARDGPAR